VTQVCLPPSSLLPVALLKQISAFAGNNLQQLSQQGSMPLVKSSMLATSITDPC